MGIPRQKTRQNDLHDRRAISRLPERVLHFGDWATMESLLTVSPDIFCCRIEPKRRCGHLHKISSEGIRTVRRRNSHILALTSRSPPLF
jgi:hypothetical protein